MNFLKFAHQQANSFVQQNPQYDPRRRPQQPQTSNREFAAKSAQAIPADVRMFSGCQDEQTSADVSNVAAFGLPPNAGPGGAGGACTNAMIAAIDTHGELTWVGLLQEMRTILQEKRYTQIPQLSTSRQIDMSSRFQIAQHGGTRKSLLIGINYRGQQGELKGCINDVLTMRTYLKTQGFAGDANSMRVLVDDPSVSSTLPTHANIIDGINWLVSGARPGDSLFFHYSGHGGQQRDSDGDETDKMDETLIPLDYRTAGQITDDVLLKNLVLPLPQGCQLTVVMDCCHSGTILDLPFLWKADAANVAAVEAGHPPAMAQNPKFSFDKLFQLAGQLFGAYRQGAGFGQMASTAFGSFF